MERFFQTILLSAVPVNELEDGWNKVLKNASSGYF